MELMIKLMRYGFGGLVCLVLILAIIGFITYRSLPDNSARKPSYSLDSKMEGKLATTLIPQILAHEGESGIYPLGDGRDAFAARLALTELAEQSLDLQYYIWHDDISGRLLMQQIYKAAERGVRVRLLLDDHTMAGMDGLLVTLNNHPNIEVRLYNPYMQRAFRPLGYLSDFFRLNRRMHNKSFTADGVVSIVGGRNIGDEYFNATNGVLFADLDLATVGDAAKEVSNDFDLYWNSESAYPAEIIIQDSTPASLEGSIENESKTNEYLSALIQSEFVQTLQKGTLPLIWAKTTLISDNPSKTLNKHKNQDTVLAHLLPIISATEKELSVVSPYFVPTQSGTELFNAIAAKGRKVDILTNTLAANDVTIVHAGYAKYRKKLLKAGVNLYELKAIATVKPEKIPGVLDSSGASLHAKTFSVDNRYLFVGSFNMDPRSSQLNTEMGLLVDKPELAKQLGESLSKNQASYSYQVKLNEEGKLRWYGEEQGENIVENQEPQSTFYQRMVVWIASKLPIEWLL